MKEEPNLNNTVGVNEAPRHAGEQAVQIRLV